MASPEQTNTKAGFVALIGAPNAGKSTLLNSLVGSKVSIVSRKVQTTRALVRGIAIEGEAQIVFVDTPRSEEHTSELQSRQYLVCRLLLEKKKTKHNTLD